MDGKHVQFWRVPRFSRRIPELVVEEEEADIYRHIQEIQQARMIKVCSERCRWWVSEEMAHRTPFWAIPLAMSRRDRGIIVLALCQSVRTKPVVRFECGLNMRLTQEVIAAMPCEDIVYMQPSLMGLIRANQDDRFTWWNWSEVLPELQEELESVTIEEPVEGVVAAGWKQTPVPDSPGVNWGHPKTRRHPCSWMRAMMPINPICTLTSKVVGMVDP